jgi:hypothetical protein
MLTGLISNHCTLQILTSVQEKPIEVPASVLQYAGDLMVEGQYPTQFISNTSNSSHQIAFLWTSTYLQHVSKGTRYQVIRHSPDGVLNLPLDPIEVMEEWDPYQLLTAGVILFVALVSESSGSCIELQEIVSFELNLLFAL